VLLDEATSNEVLMKSIADQLPPEIARQIHPDRRRNEAEYWAVRDHLIKQYQGQWIGFADGKVVASGSSPVACVPRGRGVGPASVLHLRRRRG